MSSDPSEVFILGAGFSNAVGIPLQREILPSIANKTQSQAFLDFKYAAQEFIEHKGRILELLKESFPSAEQTSLEDLFTFLDLSIARFSHVASYRWQDQLELRRSLIGAIAFVLHACVEKTIRKSHHILRDFATHLLEKRVAAGLSSDVVSVIHLNWDSLLEEEIFLVLRRANQLGVADVDYCCYTTPLDKISLHTPSLQQKTSGKFNVKIQKLHGSLNWLICPSCDRLFTGLGMKEFEREKYLTSLDCPECLRLKPQARAAPSLQPYIVSPTFLKVFQDHHIQSVWHNAFLDLQSARKVTIIGYSMPEADFHIRALLRRARLHEKDEVVVVLRESDQEGFDRLEGIGGRIKQFLGPAKANVRFFFDGAERYFVNVLGVKSTEERLPVLKGRFTRQSKQ